MKKTIFFFFVFLVLVQGAFTEEEAVQEVALIAKKWEYFPNTLTAKKGVTVKVYITSIDVTHGISFREFEKSGRKVVKGKITTFTFTPTKAGEYSFACTNFCGAGHGEMKGKIIVEE
ncbi:MAG: cupredoxin domain-containing protein [Omnitrophica bacterium]|nr:cupredoxin domain-containing protein [Candidatus Omnitrophota bacterium]